MEDITGILLNGGSSRRMGQDKRLLEYHGIPLSSQIIQVLQQVSEDVIVVGSQIGITDDIPFYLDEWPDEGALGGLVTGLKHATGKWVVVAACDMPFLSRQFYEEMIENLEDEYDAVIALKDGRMHPLCGIYKRSILPELEKAFLGGWRKMTTLSELISVKRLDISVYPEFQAATLNINTPEEWKKLK